MSEIQIERTAPEPKRKITFFRLLIVFAVIALFALILIKAPFFNINHVEISGNSAASEEEIKKAVGFYTDSPNFFLFSQSKAAKNLGTLRYVKSAKINKIFPDSLNIEITERTERCYIEYKNMNTFLLIDEDGMVLEAVSYMAKPLPVVVGVDFQAFSVGSFLETDSRKNFENVVLISVIFSKYNMTDLLKIEVSEEDDIHLFVRGLDVTFGSIDDADEKIRTLKAILESDKFANNARGFLDISDINKNPVYRILK